MRPSVFISLQTYYKADSNAQGLETNDNSTKR